MNHIIAFSLVNETNAKDATGQTKPTTTTTDAIGEQKSVYQNEYYKAEQAGIRPQGIIVMSQFDYGGQDKLIIGTDTFTVYRTFEVGTDKIELYYGSRVGNNG